jgi:hypothetical protein
VVVDANVEYIGLTKDGQIENWLSPVVVKWCKDYLAEGIGNSC